MSAEEGLLIEFIEEQEVNAEYGLKKKEVNVKGKIIIKNLTGGSLSDLELSLTGVEGTNLEKKIYIGHIKAGGEKVIDYSITKEDAMGVKIVEELRFPPEVPEPFALKCDPINIQTNFEVTNEMETPVKFTIEKVMPKPFKVSGEPQPASGTFGGGEGKIVWSDATVDAGQTTSLAVDITMHPEDTEAFDSGTVTYTWSTEGSTLSGLRFEKIMGIPKHSKKIKANERVETPHIWDISIIVKNNSKAPISVGAKIEIREGDLLTENEGGKRIKGRIDRRAPGIRPYDVVTLDPIQIAPGETGELGPITIRNPAKPKIAEELFFEIHPKVTYKVTSKGTISGITIPVVWGKISRKVEVLHEEFYSGLTPDQIAAHAEERLANITEVENLGSAGLDSIVIKDVIPEDIAPPAPGAVEVYISKKGETKIPDEILEITIEPEGSIPEEQNTLVVKVSNISYYFDEPLLQGEKIWVKYNMTSIDPKEGKKYEFGATAELAKVPNAKPRVIELEEVPTITSLLATREISIEKEVDEIEEGLFEVKIIITNDSQISIPKHEVTDLIPSTFELHEQTIEPQPVSIEVLPEGDVLVKWEISLGPNESKELKYQARARSPEARLGDLTRVYEE